MSTPVLTDEFVDVELLQDHVYCLLPSVQSTVGYVRRYTSMPEFIPELPFHFLLGKVVVERI